MNVAILLAAGKSLRAGQDKLWFKLWGRPLWTYSYETFAAHPLVDQIVLVVPPKKERDFSGFIDSRTRLATGGATRMESFKAGLRAVQDFSLTDQDVILDHNAANPHASSREISQVIQAALKHGAAAVSHAAVDTPLVVKNGFYLNALDRSTIRLMQTPQAVRGDVLAKLNLTKAKNHTDLSSALLKITPIKVLEADPRNKKISTEADLRSFTGHYAFGEDSHRFSTSGQLKLGGLTIPELPAMQANSDGDVILHAIGRALAQAKNLSFSAIADALCEGGVKDSRAYLKPLLEGLTLIYVALSLEGSKPRMEELPLAASLSKILSVPEDRIHISATSGEALTPFGRGEGLRCFCLLNAIPSFI